MECWICKQPKNLNTYCNCKNDFQYAHKMCILTWYCKYDNQICRFCKSKYKIPLCNKILYKIIFILTDICEYNLYSGVKWDEY